MTQEHKLPTGDYDTLKDPPTSSINGPGAQVDRPLVSIVLSFSSLSSILLSPFDPFKLFPAHKY
jgi:hypothetical protein